MMELLEALPFASMAACYFWLALAARDAYRNNEGPLLCRLHQNTVALFYLFFLIVCVLSLAYFYAGGFSTSSLASPSATQQFALLALLPLALIALAWALPSLRARIAGLIGYLSAMLPFLAHLFSMLTASEPKTIALACLWYALGLTLIRGSGIHFSPLLAARYPSSESKLQSWLSSPSSDSSYEAGVGNKFFTLERAKLAYPPRVHAAEIMVYCAWSLAYLAIAAFYA